MIAVSTRELAEAAARVASIIPARVVHQAHGNILMRADGGRIECTASNWDGWLTSTVPANVIEPFTACVDSRIAKVAAALPEDTESKLTLKDDALGLQCGRSRYKFECLPIEGFPDAPTFDDGAQLSLSAVDVKRLFDQAASAISAEETRYYLGGVCLEFEGSQVSAVSTDGHRLIRAAIAAPAGTEALTLRPIIPAKACKVIAGMGDCEIRINDRLIEVHADGQVLVNKLIDGTFPSYQRLIPAPSGNSAEAARADLLDALERIRHVAGRDVKNPSVKLDWSGADLQLSLARDDAEDIITATTSGVASFACRISYLVDLLKAIDTERIALDSTDPGSPIHLAAVGDDDLLAILMPTR